MKRAIDIILKTPGIEHVAPFAGLDATTFTVASNAGTIFSGLPSLYNHDIPGITANSVLADLRKRLSVIQDAYVLTIPPPPVQGIGNSGGFKMMLEDRAGLGTQALVNAANALVAAANKDPSFAGVFTLLNAGIAVGLCRHRPPEGREGRAHADRRVRHAAGLSRLAIRQRLQFPRPNLRGDRPGGRPVPAQTGRT